jgi:hypothetical protein
MGNSTAAAAAAEKGMGPASEDERKIALAPGQTMEVQAGTHTGGLETRILDDDGCRSGSGQAIQTLL